MPSPHRSTTSGLRPVAILDGEVPTGISFVRSLGRAGVPVTVYSHLHRPAVCYSRFANGVRPAPDPTATDEFADWLTDEIKRGEIDLVAPTSDYVAFGISVAHERLGISMAGHPTPAALADCLLKDRFAHRMEEAGFPAAPSATPATAEEAVEAGERLGYPVVLKPRSHVGLGHRRGELVFSSSEMSRAFGAYDIPSGHRAATQGYPELRFPMVQKYFAQTEIDIVSVAGCLGADGEILALGHCRKLRAWPPGLGVGTIFESLPPQPFTDQAVAAIREVLGVGMFELEVVIHHPTGQRWAIDLNPRAWGQIELAVASGDDIPRRWYQAVTGIDLGVSRRRRRPPRFWQTGLLFYLGAANGLISGPRRRAHARELARSLAQPRVGPVLDWADPLPAAALTMAWLRHPRGLVRNFRVFAGQDEGGR